ncbi:MAG: hypothetical protein QNJ94_21065 [Alphaproteobacteria bacterium]|nr:hypothetical protein [Alphaproteobacteria bacterium]
MATLRLSVAALCAFVLGGCAISTPFRGPGYDPNKGVTLEGEGKVVVSLTEAVLRADGERRPVFWANVGRVEASLEGREGLVGYAMRRQLFGNQAWTMTVWADEASLIAFVESAAHQTAIREAGGALEAARFARVAIDREDIPISWERALELLDSGSRQY